MPLLYRGHLVSEVPALSKMSLRRLIDYEAILWTWMGKDNSPVFITNQLNAIHREIEWRAQEDDWNAALTIAQKP